jgi:hypothetical protein
MTLAAFFHAPYESTSIPLGLVDGIIIIILTMLASFTRMFRIYFPNELTAEEIAFERFVNSYHRGTFFYDRTPPFTGLLMFITGYDESNDINTGLRGLSCLFSTAVVPLIYMAFRSLKVSCMSSFVGGLIIAFDPTLILTTHFATGSGVGQLCTALSICSIFHDQLCGTVSSLICEGLCLGFACAANRFNIVLLLFVVIREIFPILAGFSKSGLTSAVARLSLVIVLIFLVEISIISLHLKLLPFEPETDEKCPFFVCCDLLNRTNPDWMRRELGIPVVLKSIVMWISMWFGRFPTSDGFVVKSRTLYEKAGCTMILRENPLIKWCIVIGNLFFAVISSRYMLKDLVLHIWLEFCICFLSFLVFGCDFLFCFIFGLMVMIGVADQYLSKQVKGFVLAMIGAFAVSGFWFSLPFIYGFADQEMDSLY